MRRQLWVVNHHASAPMKDGRNGRHHELAKKLKELGWDVTIVVASTTHPQGRQVLEGPRLRRNVTDDGVEYLWIKSVPYNSIALMRIVGMVSFTAGALLTRNTRDLPRPDAVIGSTVHPLAAWAGLRLARRHNARFIYEIRDLWPETLVDLNAIGPRHPVVRAMKSLSLSMARQAEFVLSPLPGVDAYLDENGVHTPFAWIPNGADSSLSELDREAQETPSRRTFDFMYLGSHGRANALDTLLIAFDRTCRRLPKAELRFRLIGDGPLKPELERCAASLPYGDRINFEERIPRAKVNARAREADCLVVNLRDKGVYRYGISLNKIFDYMLAERPIIIGSSAVNNPVEDAKAGLSVAADDADALSAAMVQMYKMDEEARADMGSNGRYDVLQKYSYQTLAKRLAARLDGMFA